MSDFNISAIGVKAQRKLASGLSNRKTARLILDERANNLLDKAFKVLLLVASSRREAEKVTKSVIKLVVKIGLLARQEQFSRDEESVDCGRQLRLRFRNLIMSVSSFHRIEYTYDRCFLLDQLEACHRLLRSMLGSHLTEKSQALLELVFEFFCRPEVLDAMFQASANCSLHTAFTQLCRELDDFVDSGVI
uniref:Tumor necrosis factor alpha-induced protein 8-like protein n=1 Tax=Macrostomum lignano TaxID=282301 RepID=A0A1I8IGA3_9PLAT